MLGEVIWNAAIVQAPSDVHVSNCRLFSPRILDSANNILRIRARLFQDSVHNLTEFNLTDQYGKLSALFSINRQGKCSNSA